MPQTTDLCVPCRQSLLNLVRATVMMAHGTARIIEYGWYYVER